MYPSPVILCLYTKQHKEYIMKIGDIVKLQYEVKESNTCPTGRDDNLVALISSIDADTGRVHTDRDLGGCRHWNIEDLEEVTPYEVVAFINELEIMP